MYIASKRKGDLISMRACFVHSIFLQTNTKGDETHCSNCVIRERKTNMNHLAQSGELLIASIHEHTYIHTCIHTYIYTHTHTYIPKSFISLMPAPEAKGFSPEPVIIIHPTFGTAGNFCNLICTYVCVCMCMHMYMYECV